MVILVSLKRRTVVILAMMLLFICCSLGFYFGKIVASNSTLVVDEEIKQMLAVQIQQIFDIRNKALLDKDTIILDSFYDKSVRNGLWAHAHEIKKMNYVHSWSYKQSVQFTKIDSHVMVRYVHKKGDGYAINLVVSTEYQYIYENKTTSNTFRIGTYHSLDLMPRGEKWVITREWYTDPFADSLDLTVIKDHEVKEMILAGQPKSVNLSERRQKAVDYVDRYCGAASLPEYGFQYNPKYRNFNNDGGDCANFASQMLHEGAGFSKTYTWNYERGAGSKAWVNAHAFNQFMLNSGRASLIARGDYCSVLKSSYNLLPGDYVAYQKKGKVVHISVVSGIDSNGYALVSSHNSDRNRVPWDLGWSNKGITFWLVRVHY